MHDENPTSDGGASITERLENFLAAEDSPAPQPQAKAEQPEQATAEEETAEVVTDEPESGEPDDSTQPQLSTSDFAKVLGIDESMLDLDEEGNAIVKTKIDGKEGTAKFADVLKSYQLQGHIDNKAREVAEQQKAMQQRMQEVDQVAQAKLQQLDGVLQLAAQELTAEYQAIDWQTLRVTDPAEYAARLADFQQRQGKLQRMYQAVEQGRGEQQQKQQEQMRALLAEEAKRLPTLIPEWSDPTVAEKERQTILDWAIKSGANPARVNAMSDAFDVAAYRKAMLFDQLQQSKAKVENKVRTAPKLVKPGQPETNRQQQTVQTLKTAIRKSGGKQGVAEFLLATGKV